MIEKIARALAADHIKYVRRYDFQERTPEFLEECVDACYREFLGQARRAVQVMREPSLAMELAVDGKHGWHEGESDWRSIYTDMVEAALTE